MPEMYYSPGLLDIRVPEDVTSDAVALNTTGYQLRVTPHPQLVEIFEKNGIRRVSDYTWALSYGADDNSTATFINFYEDYQKFFIPQSLHITENNTVIRNMYNSPMREDNIASQSNAITASKPITSRMSRYISANTKFSAFIAKQDPKEYTGYSDIFSIGKERIFSAPIKPGYSQSLYHDMRTKYGVNQDESQEFAEFGFYTHFAVVMDVKKNTMYFRLKFFNFNETFSLSWPLESLMSMQTLKQQGKYHKAFNDIDDDNFDAIPLNRFQNSITGYYYNSKNITVVKELLPSQVMWAARYADRHFSCETFGNILTDTSYEILNELESKGENIIPLGIDPKNSNRSTVQNLSAKNKRYEVARKNKNAISYSLDAYSFMTVPMGDALSMVMLGDDEDSVPIDNRVIHPALADLNNMINSTPYEGEPRLYGYQKRAVGLHLSTKLGFINSMDTGIGKSIVQLSAMRERSRHIGDYRGLIVCQSNTLTQWYDYAEKDGWFPEAFKVKISSGKHVTKLIEALSTPGPVLVFCTFNMVALVGDILEQREQFNEAVNKLDEDDEDYFAKFIALREAFGNNEVTLGEILADAHWDDVSADEATSIRTTGSKQYHSLWHIRRNSDVATALTATPINKSIEDMENLLSWVRNDRNMFRGTSLAKSYNLNELTENMAREIYQILYPMVFRFTKEEAAQEEKGNIVIPKELPPETIMLTPSPAELALSRACEFELKRIVLELEEAINNFDARNDSDKEALEAARAELKDAHGKWMAGSNIARMATSNPRAILESSSMVAQLLVSQGLVANALKDTPTKHRYLLKRVQENVVDNKQVLVFTEFVDVAKEIVAAFQEIGIRAEMFAGSNTSTRDKHRVAFQEGDLDVLVCTKAAERGLTLHRAAIAYHYDTAWTLEPLLQKSGRHARVGALNEEVETVILILKDTIEERVIENVFNQGTTSSMVLDKSRGVDLNNTTQGKLMGSIMNASQSINSRRGALEFGKALLGIE